MWILICLAIACSCGKGPGEKNKEKMGVLKITNISIVTQSEMGDDGIFPITSKSYNMSAIMIESASGLPVANEFFSIDRKEEGVIEVQSDNFGQIYWNEQINFNILNDKKRVLLERSVKAKKDPSDPLPFYLSYYPLSQILSEDIADFEFYFDKQNTADFITKKQAIERPELKSALNLKEGVLVARYIGPAKEGGKYHFNFEGKLTIAVKTKNDRVTDIPARGGQFEIHLLIYSKNKQNKLLLEKKNVGIDIINEKISFSFEEFFPMVGKFDDLFLGIKVIPLSRFDQYTIFEGERGLGKIADLATQHEIIFEKEKNSRNSSQFKIPKFVSRSKADGGDQNINFSNLIPIYDYIEDGETPTKRSIIYRSSTCVSDLHNDEVLAFDEFKIIKATGEEIILPADSKGCIFWNEMIKHKYYKPENFVRRENTITHLKSGISKKIVSYINPWTILTIGRDAREMDQNTLEKIKQREIVYSRLFLEQFSFETIGVNYHVDEFMTLFVRKNIQLDLEFQVTRYSSLTEGLNAKEDIRDGVYLLKVAFEKSYIDTRKSRVEIDQKEKSLVIKKSETRRPIEYIYVVKNLIRVWNGHIITPIELSIHDLRLMTVRSNFLLQLQTIDQDLLDLKKNFDIKDIRPDRVNEKLKEKFPGRVPDLDLLVDHDSGLPSRTFVGPMILLEMEGGADVRPTDAINVCGTEDCNYLEEGNKELQKRVYSHDKKYYGHINHLIDQSVDDMFKRKSLLDLKYRNEKKVESLLYNYLNSFNLTFVSDEDEKILSLPNGEKNIHCNSSKINSCLIENNSHTLEKKDFLEIFSGGPVENKVLQIGDLFNPKILNDFGVKERLCDYFSKNVSASFRNRLKSGVNLRRREKARKKSSKVDEVYQHCLVKDSFMFNKVIRTKGIESFNFLGGKTVNFDLGSSISIEQAEAFSTEAAMDGSGSVTPTAVFNFISERIGDFLDGTISYSVLGSSSQEYANSSASEFTSTTYLAMQRAAFDFKFSRPNICLEIRWKKDVVAEMEELLLEMEGHSGIVYNPSFLTKGFFVCHKDKDMKLSETSFREYYYYFAQHFTEGHMLDDGSILNHPWLLGLRGKRDYHTFIKYLERRPIGPKKELDMISTFFAKATNWRMENKERFEASFMENDVAELPLEQISKAFEHILPSFPGIYVVMPKVREYPYD